MGGLSSVDMEVTGTVDTVGRGMAVMEDTECLSWEDMVVMAATVAAHIMKMCHAQPEQKLHKDSSAGTVLLLSTERGSSVVNVVKPFSDFEIF